MEQRHTPSPSPSRQASVHAPEDPAVGAQVSTAARRRALLRAAASAPVLAGLAPGTALAQASAYRAAGNDAQIKPDPVLDTHDGWMRASVPFGSVTETAEPGSTVVYPYVFQIGGELITVDAPFDAGVKGTPVILTGDQTFQSNSSKLVLVLFGQSGNSYAEIGKWPKYEYPEAVGLFGPAQGLHCSSWTSFAGEGSAPYPCTGG